MLLVAALLQLLTLGVEEGRPPRLDGGFRDWGDAQLRPIDDVLEGTPLESDADLEATLRMSFDGAQLHLGVEVKDDAFMRGGAKRGDRLEIRVGGRTLEVVLNDLDRKKPSVVERGRRVKGAAAGGTTFPAGWAVEISLPLSALPDMRGDGQPFAVVVLDSDTSPKRADTVLSTRLPPVRIDPGASIYEDYTHQETDPPVLRRLRGDIAEDPHPEDVVINARDVVVYGPWMPHGPGYAYFTHGWGLDPKVLTARLEQVDGRPGLELVVEHSEWEIPGEVQVEVVEVYTLKDSAVRRLFAQRTGERFPKMGAEARAPWKLLGRRGARKLQVSQAKVKGLNPGNYVAGNARGAFPLPLPWTAPKQTTYVLRGDAFAPAR